MTFLAGRALLAELMHQLFNQPLLPEIVICPQGKPAFADPALPFFNLSHSGDRLLAVVSESGPVGCDIEIDRQRRGLRRLASEVFTAAENQWINHHPSAQTAFWQLWSLREALLKQRGQGVWGMSNIRLYPMQQAFLSPDQASRLYLTAVDSSLIVLALPEPSDEIPHWQLTSQQGRLERAAELNWQCYRPLVLPP